MNNIDDILFEFKAIAANPKSQFEKYLAEGRKIVGCLPYFCPEELVYAAGILPFGLWGAETKTTESGRYLPAFICSILHTTLELGLRGAYEGLLAVMIPILCDSLKGMDANWRYGVKTIPVIPVAHAQNRRTPAGVEFTASQYRRIKKQLAELAGRTVTDGDVADAVAVYNARRAVMRRFIDLSASHPGLVTPSQRNAVFKSAYFMDAREHTEKVEALNAELERLPESSWRGATVVTSGIIADSTGFLDILESCGIAVVDDEVTHESLPYRTDVPVTGDPVVGLAEYIGNIEGCPVLFDPGKRRGTLLVELAKRRHADGVLLVQTKFCDPEEFDYVPIKRMLDAAGIPSLQVEIDQQTPVSGQMRTSIETFCDILGERRAST